MAFIVRAWLAIGFLSFAGHAYAQPAAPAPVPAPAPAPAPAQAAPPVAVPVPAPTPIQPGWVARGTAELQVLDKVNARTAVLSVKIGQAIRYGAIEIAVQACFARPAEQSPDAAAFLVVTDPRPGASGFRGWMFAANPTIAILEHPIYDIRVLACRP